MNKAVSYSRVSTGQQSASGLGLEAQQLAVEQFAKAYHYDIVEEIIEIESGKKNNRPLLQAALQSARNKKRRC